MILFSIMLTFFISIISLIYVFFNGMELYFENFLLAYLFSGFWITIFSLIFLYFFRNHKLRLVFPVQKPSDTLYYREPPFSYSPVIVTYLENLNLEINKDIFAELLFLSQKGFLHIEKISPNDYRIVKNYKVNNNFNDLLESQKFILSYIDSGMALSDFLKLMRKYKRKLEKLYESDCFSLGYLNKLTDIFKNTKLKKILSIILLIPIVFLFILSVLFSVIPHVLISDIITFIFIFYTIYVLNFMPSLGIAFLMQIIFGNLLLIRTEKAKEDYSKWLAFKDFLIDYTMIKNYDNLESLDLFEHYLTYSVALGITKINLK